MVHVLVKTTFHVIDTTKAYLYEHDKTISDFLDRHYGCELRMVWRDDQMEAEAVKPHLLRTYHSCDGTCFCEKCKPT